METTDPIEIKFGTVDYVGEGTRSLVIHGSDYSSTLNIVNVMRAISPFVIFVVFDVQVLRCCR